MRVILSAHATLQETLGVAKGARIDATHLRCDADVSRATAPFLGRSNAPRSVLDICQHCRRKRSEYGGAVRELPSTLDRVGARTRLLPLALPRPLVARVARPREALGETRRSHQDAGRASPHRGNAAPTGRTTSTPREIQVARSRHPRCNPLTPLDFLSSCLLVFSSSRLLVF